MKKIFHAAACALLAAALGGCGQRDERHYELAMRYKEGGDHDRAIGELRTALRINPRFMKAYNQLGVCYGKVGLYDKAAEQFERAIGLDPSFATGYYNLGILYQTHLDRPADAARAYRRYLDLSPPGPRAEAVKRIVEGLMEDPGIRSALADATDELQQAARVFEERGEYARAVEAYEKVAAKGGAAGARAHLDIARISETRLDKTADALRHYQAYLDANLNAPDAAEVMSAIGRLRGKAGIPATPAPAAGEAIAQAEGLLKDGQLPRAIGILIKARDGAPDNEHVHDLLAEAYLKSGDLKGAEKEYEWLRARQADFAYGKELAGIYGALGDEALGRGDFPGAEEKFAKALELSPNDAALHGRLAKALAGTGKLQKAMDEAGAAKALAPGSMGDDSLADLSLNNGRWLVSQGRFDEASRAFSEAKRLKPGLDISGDMAGICEARAAAALGEGRFSAAERECLRAIELDPKRAGVRRKLAEAYEGLGRYDAEIRELEKFAGAGGDEGAAAVKEMARIHETFKGDSAKAMTYYKKYLETKPKSADAREIEKKVKEAEKEKEQVGEYRKKLAKKPSSVSDHYNLAVLLQRQGKYREAIDAYRRAIAIEPGNAQAHFNLGYCYDRLRMSEEAIAEYRAAIQVKPDYLKAYSNLAAIYKQKRWYGKAIAMFRKAIEIDPNYAHAHLGLGAVYDEGLHDRQKAVHHYTQYLRLNPQGPFAPQVRAWLGGRR